MKSCQNGINRKEEKMKKFIKSLFVLTLLFILGACGNKEKTAEKEESSVEENKEPTYQERLDAYEADKKEKIGGMVKIPETSGYSKEHVEAMFELVDLKVEFVEASSDSVKLGLCGYPNTSVEGIVEFGEIGDMFRGYYAKPGSTIIVPLRSSDNGQSDSNKNKESGSNTDTNSSDVATQLKNINAQYDKMIEKIQGYIDNPTTYKTTTSIEFLKDYNQLLEEFGKLNTEAMTDDQTLQMLTDINTKHTTLLLKIGELPTPTN